MVECHSPDENLADLPKSNSHYLSVEGINSAMIPPRGTASSARRSFSPAAHPGAIEDEKEEEAAISISDQRTLYLVNIFIGNTARFLNSFSSLCEDKLALVHRRILRIDANLSLLEAQLRSTSSNRELEYKPHSETASSSRGPVT